MTSAARDSAWARAASAAASSSAAWLGQGAERLQPSQRGDLLLGVGPQPGRGLTRLHPTGPGNSRESGARLLLGRAGLGQGGGGTFRLGQRGDDLGGPDGRVEF